MNSSMAISATANPRNVVPPASEPDDGGDGGLTFPSSPPIEDVAIAGEAMDIDTSLRRCVSLAALEAAYASEPGRILQCLEWRRTFLTWYSELAESFDIEPETVSVAMNYVDRFVSLRRVDACGYQLTAAIAIWLAFKVMQQRPITLSDVVTLCDGLFDEDEIKDSEGALLEALDFRLHPPTVHASVLRR